MPERRERDKCCRAPANDRIKIVLEKLFSEHSFKVDLGKSNKNGKIIYTSVLSDSDGKVCNGMTGVIIPEAIRQLVDLSMHIKGTAHYISLRIIVKPEQREQIAEMSGLPPAGGHSRA